MANNKNHIINGEKLVIAYSFICQILLILTAILSVDGQLYLTHLAALLAEPLIMCYLIYMAVTRDKKDFLTAIKKLNISIVLLVIIVWSISFLSVKKFDGLSGRKMSQNEDSN